MFCHLRRGIPAVLLSFQLFAHHGVAAWTWRDPLPQGNSLDAIAYSPALDTSVAIGDFGACVLKAGSGAWASVPAFSGNQSLSSVVWANNRFLAAGGTAGLWTSANGTAWAQGQSGVSGSIIAGETGKIAVLSGNQVWVSDDASAWTSVPLPPPPDANSHYRALAFLGGTFVATGDAGLVARSVDGGRTWSSVTSGFSSNLDCLAAGSGKFVAAGWYYTNAATGEYSAQVIHSTDGQTWAAGTIPTPPAGNYFYSVLPVASGFLAGASAGLFFSQDGSQWSAAQGAPTDFFPSAAASDGAAGTFLVGNRGGIFRLDSSLAWERQTSGAINGTFLWLPRFSSAALGNLVLAKDDNRRAPAIYRSDDAGTTWTEQSGDVFLRQMSGLTTSGSRIMAYSDGDGTRVAGVYSTTDGTTWQLVTPSEIPWTTNATFTRVNSLASNSSESVTLALTVEATFDEHRAYIATRKLYRSTAWGAWSLVRLAAVSQFPPQWNSVETVFWDGTKFVMLLYPGRIFTSTNGLSWTQLPALPKDSLTTLSEYVPSGAPAANTAFSVASNGSLLVARSEKLGATGDPGPWENGYARFFSYVKGKWQENSVRISSPSSHLNQIFWDGSSFLAPVPGRLLASSDAITWREWEVGASLQTIVPSALQLVGFTTETAVITSPVGETSVAPSARISPTVGDAFSVSVTSTDFSWSAVANVPWIQGFAPVGSGNATLSISVQPNKTSTARSGSIKIGRAALVVTQPSSTAFVPKTLVGTASSATIPFTGGWSAQADQPWATFPAASGSGPVKVNFSANPSSSSRVVNVTVNGLLYSFTQAGNAPAASYSGAVGELGDILPPLLTGTNQPLAPHFLSVNGSLTLTVSSPSPASPDGAYSATLNFFDGTANLVFRGKGNMGPGGILQNATWTTGGRTPRTVAVSLSPLANGAGSQGLAGTALLAGNQTCDVLAGKQIYSAKSNPWPVAESLFTMTLPVTDDPFAGTGACTVAISSDGVAKIAGRLGDGSAITLSSPVWGATGAPAEKILFLATPVANNLGFLGGWLARQVVAPGPWVGAGTCALPGFAHPIAPAMSPYAKPAPNSPAVNWPAPATLNIINADFLNLGGNVTINSANKLAVTPASGNVSYSLVLNPATGAVSGQCSYLPLGTLSPKKATATICGVLDQSTRRIDGLILFSPANTGILEIVP